LTRPLVVWCILVGVLCIWHIPGIYGLALAHGWIHDLEHLSFIAAGLAYWTVVIEPYGRRRALSYGATIVYVVSIGFIMGMIGAILTFAPIPFYAAQLKSVVAFGLTPLADQELAGAIMWVPAEIIQLAALSVLALAWLREDERRAAHVRTVLPSSTATLRSLAVVPIALVLVATLVGCGRHPDPYRPTVSGGNPQRGKQAIIHYGCDSCHTIPGVPGARGLVAPPLTHWRERNFVAGLLRNRPDNLVYWIRDPQKVIPGVAMPDLGVSEQEARDIAAYLYTIH
ncbi:MAG TPA: cytochrome c oxidase assembly protein, partial [Gammaproteobacteria bacterium]|nr:cytochrome c oxidase assembly protein [Gammaproteobacteria bacterium]